jgi:hypothetical protein
MVTDIHARRFLTPFIGQERTVSEVAAELQVHMSSVLYRVRQFIRLGLVGEPRLEPRKGKPIKYYRSVADGFFVPFRATPLEAQEALSPHTFSEFQRALNESVGQAWLEAAGEPQPLGVHIYRDDNGRLNYNIVPDPEADRPTRFFDQLLEPNGPAVWDTWGHLRLLPQDAKTLQLEIASLLGRYRPKVVHESGSEYIVRLAMAPLKH